MNIIVFQVYQIENLIPNEIIKFLLKNKVNINLFNIEEQTALIIAAQKGYNDVVKLLLEKEADALIVDNYQKSTLSYASEKGYTEITEMLIPLSF